MSFLKRVTSAAQGVPWTCENRDCQWLFPNGLGGPGTLCLSGGLVWLLSSTQHSRSSAECDLSFLICKMGFGEHEILGCKICLA